MLWELAFKNLSAAALEAVCFARCQTEELWVFFSSRLCKNRAVVYFQDWFNASVYYLPDFTGRAVVRVGAGLKLPISMIPASKITARFHFYVHHSLLLSLLLYRSGNKTS